jgi:hypothetical protein
MILKNKRPTTSFSKIEPTGTEEISQSFSKEVRLIFLSSRILACFFAKLCKDSVEKASGKVCQRGR